MTAPLLTPEMMARAIVSEPDWWQPGPDFLIDFDKLRAHIAQAIAFDRGYASGERLQIARQALDQIDRHVVGSCALLYEGDMPEPCEECGEMREIAAQALKAIKGRP
jgi:hypothetical protein